MEHNPYQPFICEDMAESEVDMRQSIHLPQNYSAEDIINFLEMI